LILNKFNISKNNVNNFRESWGILAYHVALCQHYSKNTNNFKFINKLYKHVLKIITSPQIDLLNIVSYLTSKDKNERNIGFVTCVYNIQVLLLFKRKAHIIQELNAKYTDSNNITLKQALLNCEKDYIKEFSNPTNMKSDYFMDNLNLVHSIYDISSVIKFNTIGAPQIKQNILNACKNKLKTMKSYNKYYLLTHIILN